MLFPGKDGREFKSRIQGLINAVAMWQSTGYLSEGNKNMVLFLVDWAWFENSK